MSIPESIRNNRPTKFGAVEIRCIGGHYYTYLVSSKWDAIKGRPQKITGKSIGKITEADGFIPITTNGLSGIANVRAETRATTSTHSVMIQGAQNLSGIT